MIDKHLQTFFAYEIGQETTVSGWVDHLANNASILGWKFDPWIGEEGCRCYMPSLGLELFILVTQLLRDVKLKERKLIYSSRLMPVNWAGKSRKCFEAKDEQAFGLFNCCFKSSQQVKLSWLSLEVRYFHFGIWIWSRFALLFLVIRILLEGILLINLCCSSHSECKMAQDNETTTRSIFEGCKLNTSFLKKKNFR